MLPCTNRRPQCDAESHDPTRGQSRQASRLSRAPVHDSATCVIMHCRTTFARKSTKEIPFLTHLPLQHLPPADIDRHLLASYLSCCNRSAEAEELLREARTQGYRSAETSKLSIELLSARADHADARALAEGRFHASLGARSECPGSGIFQ